MGRRKVRELKDLVDVAKTAAGRAADYLRGLTPAAPGQWVEKGRHDFVTDADRTAERLIAETLTSGVPGSTVVGEELTPGAAPSGDVVWIVDPLDGTTNFLHGYPQYAVSVGALVRGTLAVGVVRDVTRGLIYSGATDALRRFVETTGIPECETQADTVDTAADDPAQLYYSSGTTGLAKGILHAHRYILAHEEFVYCHDVRDSELFHGMGEWAWAAGIAPLLGPWRLGATQFVYVREGGFDPKKQLEVLSRHGVTNVFTTPTAMRAMMAIGDAGERYPQRFRVVCSAGEPLNPEAIRWFREQYGITVLDYYGLTESYPLCANYPFMEVREGSMGKPVPGWDVQILDEDERPVAQGERGEICLRARSNPHYPLGYWNNPEASEETFGGEWFHTKDAAQRDEDGYFWYAGRADDVIISAGYRIGPFEVESACIEHPAVREAAAVASPDAKRGHVVKAFVVLAEGRVPSEELAGEIKTFIRGHLSAYAYPRKIEFVDDLPKTLTGKIRRIELREKELGA